MRIRYNQILREQLLLEITLNDHFDNYGSKFGVDDFNYYKQIATLDPTSNNGEIKGKYTEWLLKRFGNWSVSEFEDYIESNDVYKWLKDLMNVRGFNINDYKGIKGLKNYYESLSEEDLLSSKEKKKLYKDILKDEDNIEVIYRDSEWFVGKPITQEGNIKMARYKTDKSAKWCTADSDRPSHWERYKNEGELYTFIPLDDPDEKFHVHIVNNEVKECNDFDNLDYPEGREIMERLNDETDGALFKKLGIETAQLPPLVITLDEDAFIEFCFEDYWFDNIITNRPMADHETIDDATIIYDIKDYRRLFSRITESIGKLIDERGDDKEHKIGTLVKQLDALYYDEEENRSEIKIGLKHMLGTLYVEINNYIVDRVSEDIDEFEDVNELTSNILNDIEYYYGIFYEFINKLCDEIPIDLEEIYQNSDDVYVNWDEDEIKDKIKKEISDLRED